MYIDHDKITMFVYIALIILVVYVIVINRHSYHKHDANHNIISHTSPISSTHSPVDDTKHVVVNVTTPQQHTNPLRDYDYRTLLDPLVPPYKRDDYMTQHPGILPISTRGSIGVFKKIGLLIDDHAANSDPYKFMILMGRLKYQGSNYYDYYVTENKPDSALKFDFPDIHKEFTSGDSLHISELGKTYTVKIDRTLGFDYVPF